MLDALISSILQVGFVLLIALVLWLLSRRTEPFRRFVGLFGAPWSVAALAFVGGAVLALLLTRLPGLQELASGERTVAGSAAAGGSSAGVVAALTIRAVIQTSLSEELLFRGLIGRHAIRRWGFAAGNAIQAALFGLAHLLLLLSPTATPGAVAALVAFTAVTGWLLGWANARFANGSILPGWAAHAGGNLLAYHLLAFG